jgi:hypothetical protein
MGKVKQDFVAKFQTVKDGEVEEHPFSAGEAVTVVQTWLHHFLIKDKDGHFYNIKKELIEP